MTVDPVIFNDMNYKLLGFVEVISNVKGKGFGKKLIQHMLNYLKDTDTTGMGFTMPKNTGFYEICGLSINRDSTQRFVYIDGDKRVTNQDGQVIFYMDSSDNFMKEVLAHPDKEVILPTAGLW